MVSDIIAFGDGFFWKANKSSFVAASKSAGCSVVVSSMAMIVEELLAIAEGHG